MPLFHVGGSCYAQVGIHGGARTILLREPTPGALFGAIASGATHTFVVPTVIHGVLAAGEQAVTAFGALKSISYGAAPMPLPMLRQALDAWPRTELVQVYGMTELSGVATLLSAEAHRDAAHPERLASGGLPLPGVEVRVVDPVTLEDVKPGERGEIWFRSAQAMRGYLNRPEATAQTKTADGWIRSGDIGRTDDAGFVYVLDRVKDMIITGGENVYGPEVENVLNACPGVSEGVIIGIPDDRWGESVKAVVVPAAGAELSAARHHRLLPRPAGPLPVPDFGRLRRSPAAQRNGQGAQARLARALLGRPGTGHLTIDGHDPAHIGSASGGSGTVNAFSRNEISV